MLQIRILPPARTDDAELTAALNRANELSRTLIARVALLARLPGAADAARAALLVGCAQGVLAGTSAVQAAARYMAGDPDVSRADLLAAVSTSTDATASTLAAVDAYLAALPARGEA